MARSPGLPFASRSRDLACGRMHFVDEGSGPSVLMLHGNPTWSFLYRHLISRLRATHRCVAPDHLGFGVSDQPPPRSYTPAAHAHNLARLVAHLDLRDLTLVVQDWGGPVGRWLIQRHNYFAGGMMRQWFGDRHRLTPAIHQQYLQPLAHPEEHTGCMEFPRQILGASAWLDALRRQRGALEGLETLLAKLVRSAIVWGMKEDIAFRRSELEQWAALFPRAEVVRLAAAGHFVQEEAPLEVGEAVAGFLARTR